MYRSGLTTSIEETRSRESRDEGSAASGRPRRTFLDNSSIVSACRNNNSGGGGPQQRKPQRAWGHNNNRISAGAWNGKWPAIIA